MGKKKVLAAFVAILLGTPFVVSAQQADERGFYVGGSTGQMEAEGSCTAGLSCDLKDTGWKAFLGYRFGRHFAVEGSYGQWGEISATNGVATVTGEIETLSASAVGILPLGSRFELFGKIGISSTDQKFRATGPGVAFAASNDGSEALFGVGATFNVTKNFGIRGEWERLNDSEVDLLSIGIQYKF